MRTLVAALAVSVGIGGALVACGGDDQFVQPGGDGGPGGDATPGDGGHTGDGGDAGDGGKIGDGSTGDGGEGGPSNCAFTNFVISTIATGTKENTQPVPNAMIPDAACSLSGSLQDYSTLQGFH